MRFDVTIKDTGNDNWKRFEVLVVCEEKDVFAFGYGPTEIDAKTMCHDNINKYIKTMVEFRDKFLT